MKTRFNEEDIDRLGKFKVNSYRGEILNLIGYLVLPTLQDDCRIIIDNEDLIGIFVIYGNDEKPRLGFRDDIVDLLSNYYYDYNILSRADAAIIDSDRCCIGKKDIEDFLLKALIDSIEYYKIRINRACKKWPQRDKCSETLKEIEDNIDQLYILKTDFYGG
jgi:hypothetical protein